MAFTRQAILTRLKKAIGEDGPSSAARPARNLAKFEEARGIDIWSFTIQALPHSRPGSMASLMPYGDANAIVMKWR
jgi:predicted TIM-barrel enzyme